MAVSALKTAEPPAQKTAVPVDTLRGGAILLVVLYHVIGSGPKSGLSLDYGTFWRAFADITNEIHMPIFAALAGLVYAMQPVSAASIPQFLARKIVRLAIPGAVAIALFVLAAQFVNTPFDQPLTLWNLIFYPFAHFWFIQAILVVFAVLVVTDALSGGRAGEIWLVLGSVMLLGGHRMTAFLAINQAVWLIPFAALGVLFWRNRDGWLERVKPALIVLSLAAILAGFAADLMELSRNNQVNHFHSAPLNFVFSMGICSAALLLCPRIPALAWLGPASFVIYLYHPLFTSATRRALDVFGSLPLGVYLFLGVVIGTLAPMAIYYLAMQSSISRRIVIGLRK